MFYELVIYDLFYNPAVQIQMLGMLAENVEAISEFFSLPQYYVGKKTDENSAEIFVYYIGNGFEYLGILPRAMIWFFNS